MKEGEHGSIPARHPIYGRMVKWQHTSVLEADAARRGGSSPSTTTNLYGGCYDNAKREERKLKRVRVREHHERDFNLYLQFGDMISYFPTKQEGDPNGYTPIQCYVLIDSHGERSGPFPCTDYQTLEKVLKGKGNVNLQIQMWVETTMDSPLVLSPDEVKSFGHPDWVFDSYIRRLSKEWSNKHGWLPSFIRKYL